MDIEDVSKWSVPSTRNLLPWFYRFLVLAVIVATASVAYILGSSNSTSKQVSSDKQPVCKPEVVRCPEKVIAWSLELSSTKAFVFSDYYKEKSFLYYLDTAEIKEIAGMKAYNDGSSGYGSNRPLTSPDLLYTVYIEVEDDGSLSLLSHETLESAAIVSGARYITGWTPDSRNIIFYINEDTMVSRADYYRERPDMEQFSEGIRPGGFYKFNIYSGELTWLHPISSVEAIIDSERLLIDIGGFNTIKFAIFDTDLFQVDYKSTKTIDIEEKLSIGQITFNKDGSNWLYLFSFDPTNDANIIFAPFPNVPLSSDDFVKVKSAGWAGAQGQKLSPDEKYIAYVYERSGSTRGKLMLYDIESKKERELQTGYWLWWMGNNMLFIEARGENFDSSDYYVYNLEDNSSKLIYSAKRED